MIVSVMTNNYQERQIDMQQHVKDLESDLKIALMDKEEAEEMLQTAYEKIKKLESEMRALKTKMAKLRKPNEETKVD